MLSSIAYPMAILDLDHLVIYNSDHWFEQSSQIGNIKEFSLIPKFLFTRSDLKLFCMQKTNERGEKEHEKEHWMMFHFGARSGVNLFHT